MQAEKTGNSLQRRDIAVENAQSIIDSYSAYQGLRGGGSLGGGYQPMTASTITTRETTPGTNYHTSGLTGNTAVVTHVRKLPLPLRNKETMEQSHVELQMFLQQTQRAYNEDEFVSNALTSNLQELSHVTKCAEYSESVRLRQYKGFIPFYITNVAQSYQTCEILYKPTQGSTTTTIYHDVLAEAFLSCRDYAQRSEPECPLDIEATPKGNLKNCMMVTVCLSDIVNNTDMYAAVTLCHETGSDNLMKKKSYNVWGNREYTLDKSKLPQGTDLDNQYVHWVIPPRSNSSKEVCIYKSGFEVNNPLAARYPEFDGTVEWLQSPKSKTAITRGEKVVYTSPADHPLVEWLFRNRAFYPSALSLPVYKPGNDLVPMYQISEHDFLAAAHEYCNEFNLSVPVVDLNKMKVCIQWIPATDQTNINLRDLERAIKDLEYKADAKLQKKIKDYYEAPGGLSFQMYTEHIFRDQYKETNSSLQ